jgi:hypothetical protein
VRPIPNLSCACATLVKRRSAKIVIKFFIYFDFIVI